MKIYCPKHNENHNVMPKQAELLIYYLRRLYVEAAYAKPMIVTAISNGPEYTYNRTCVLTELDDIKNPTMMSEEGDFYINVARAYSDYNTRRRLDGEKWVSQSKKPPTTRGRSATTA